MPILTEVVGGECWILKLPTDLLDIFFCAPDEKDGFQVHELLCRDVINHIDEEYFLLKDLSSRVYH